MATLQQNLMNINIKTFIIHFLLCDDIDVSQRARVAKALRLRTRQSMTHVSGHEKVSCAHEEVPAGPQQRHTCVDILYM